MLTNDNIHEEKVRQYVDAIQEFLVFVPEYLSLIWTYAALGNAAGVENAMRLLAACVRAALATSIELAELRASLKGGEA
jgi:hypothetical protein